MTYIVPGGALNSTRSPYWRTQKTNVKTSHIKRHGKVTYLGSRNPWTDRYKILHAGCCPEPIHACQVWWRLVKEFWRGEGSNFGLFRWLTSSLQHSRTTLRVCDGTGSGFTSIFFLVGSCLPVVLLVEFCSRCVPEDEWSGPLCHLSLYQLYKVDTSSCD